VAFVIVLAIVTHGALDTAERRVTLPLLIAVCILSLVAGASRLAPGIPSFFMAGKWAGISVHEQSRHMAALAQPHGTSGALRIATLWPVYALEGDASIYPEFAGGPFVYRIANHIPAADRRYFRTTSEAGLAAFLDRSPPSAVIVRTGTRLDGPFRDYALARGYHPYPIKSSDQLELYVRQR
jgi:hypothetical protein